MWGRTLRLLMRLGGTWLLLELSLCAAFELGGALLPITSPLYWVLLAASGMARAVIVAIATAMAVQASEPGALTSLSSAVRLISPRLHVLLPLGVALQLLGVFGLLLLVLPFMWFAAVSLLAAALVALEGYGGWAAVLESRRRMQGFKWLAVSLFAPLVALAAGVHFSTTRADLSLRVARAVFTAPAAYAIAAAFYLETLPWARRARLD
jgi:hypothetical protein